ncbi:MAG: DUF2480 family protein [Bacteroidia bacterium]|nr:DUF2480 family protein [Bacteroidia bacterium]
MSDEIVNRVAQSSLVVLDLEEIRPSGERVLLDIKDWLYEGLVLREKEFRARVEDHDWSQYTGSYVALNCSSDAIIPVWAYMLITTRISPYAKQIVQGDLEFLENTIFALELDHLDLSPFTNKPTIIKGCSKVAVPANAYLMATQKLEKVAKSIMYGEACSAVPLIKRK